MGAWVPLAVALLLLSTSSSGSSNPFAQVKDCRDLKAAIEGHASAAAAAVQERDSAADLTVQLHSDLPYLCEASILIAEAQSVVLVGCRDGLSNVHVAPDSDSRQAMTRSLFVNRGALRLENLTFYLDSSGEDGVDGEGDAAAAIGGGSEVGSEKKEENPGACVGGARLVRNFGHVALQGVSAYDASSDGVWRPERRCERIAQGRVVYSEQGKSRNGGSSTGRSVVVSHSNFNFAQDGSGASAFHANGGKVAIETSRFDTQEVSPFQREEKSGSSVGLEGLEVAPALAVMDGNLIVTNTVFLGFGLEEGWGSGAIAFEESDGEEGQHRFLMSDCRFLGSNGDRPQGAGTTSARNDLRSRLGESDAASHLRQQRSVRRLKSCGGMLCLDQGLLLVIISAGLFAILMGMCCLENWLRMHPDGLDRWLPRRFRSTRGRRVQHDHHAEKAPPSHNIGVHLGGLETAGVGAAAFSKPLAVINSGIDSTARGDCPFSAASAQLHADQYSVYDGTCDEEVSFVVPQTFKKVLAKPQANVRSSISREPGLKRNVSLDDDAATTVTTESRSSSNGSTAAAVDGTRAAYLGHGTYMNDEPPSSAVVHSATAGAATANGRDRNLRERDQRDYQGFGAFMESTSHSSSAASAVTASDAPGVDSGQLELDRDIREDSISFDSLEGVETDATPCDSVSTSTDMYESGSAGLIRSPLSEATIQAFASVNSLSAAALESSPVTQMNSYRRLGIASGDRREETKAEESDGEDSAVATEETEGRWTSDIRRSGSSAPPGSGCMSPGGNSVASRDSLWVEECGRAPSTIVDDEGLDSTNMSATAPGRASAPGIVLKSAPFSPLQSPAESSFTALSMGAVSKMLRRMHGGDAVPAAEGGHPRAVAPAVAAARPPVPPQHDSDMCYSPDSDCEREDAGAGFHGNNPMPVGRLPSTEETVDGSAVPAAAAGRLATTVSATRPPCSQTPKDDGGGSRYSSSPAASRTDNENLHSARPSSLSRSPEAAVSPPRKAAGVIRSAPVNSAPSAGRPSQQHAGMLLAAPEPVELDNDGMCYSSPSTDENDDNRHDDGMCYSSPSTDDGGGDRKDAADDDDDRRMFAVSPAFSSPGRCMMGVSPDHRDGHLVSRRMAGSALDTSTPQVHDGFAPASTSADRRNDISPANSVGLGVSNAEHRIPGSLPATSTAGDFDGAGAFGAVPAACTALSPVTSSYSLYCSPPSTAGGPSPEGTPGRPPDYREEGSLVCVMSDRPRNPTIDGLDKLPSA